MASYAKGCAYERQVRDYLQENEGYPEAYLWQSCPERILDEAGLIGSWQRYRMRRRKLAQMEADPAFKNPLRDTGIDIMARMPNGGLDAVQCKAYGPKTTVRVGDLTGFMGNLTGILLHRPDARGSLFYDGKLSRVIEDQFAHPALANRARIVRLPFAQCQRDPTPAIRLREDQHEALDACIAWWKNGDAPGRVHLEAPCGFGKTVVAGEFLMWLGGIGTAKGAAFMVPLIEHAQHMYDRLIPYAQDGWEIVLVDSEGERDVEYLRQFFGPGKKPVLVVSTYKSSDVVCQLPWGDRGWLVVVDEFHNLSRADLGIGAPSDLHRLLAMAPRVLGMSATPRIFELEGSEEDGDGWMGPSIYQMSWGVAIKRQIISDYRIYVPSLSEPKEHLQEQGAELGIGDIARPLQARCEFLLKGMLEEGLRRCIVYMPTGPGMCAERTAAEYTDMLGKIAGWMGIDVCTGTILGCTGRSARKQLLAEFQDGPVQTAENRRPIIRILLSVRILDECVDIPSCDSVFFAAPCRSKVRGLQRAARCMRRVAGKMPGVFVWCDESYDELAELLGAIKEKDALFDTKIRVLSASYDRRGEVGTTAAAAEDRMTVEEYVVGVREYMTGEERAMQRAREVVAFVGMNQRLPRRTGKDVTEAEGMLEAWLNNQRVARRGKGSRVSYESVVKYLDEYIPGWSDDRESLALSKAREVVAFVDENRRLPRAKKKGVPEAERSLGKWLSRQHSAIKGTSKHKSYESVVAYLDEHLPKWYTP